MDFLVFADLHISEQLGLAGGNRTVETDDGPRRRSLAEARECLGWIAQQTEALDPDAVLFAGDLYDRANPTPNEESVALEGVQRLADLAPTYVLLGNHTQSLGDAESALASLRAVRHPDVHVIEAPRVVDLGGAYLYCVPYPALGRIVDPAGEGWSKELRNGKVSAALDKIVGQFASDASDADKPGILFAHVTFAGAEYTENRAVPMSDVRVPTDALPAFDAVAAGHLHRRQQIGLLPDAWYVGPPDRWTYHDENQPAGIAHLDLGRESPKFRFRAYPDARIFETVEPADLEDLADNPPADADRRFVRVRGEVDDLEAIDRLERIRDDLRGTFGAIRLDVEVPDDDREVTEVDPGGGLRAIFETYCDDRPDAIPEERRDDVFDVAERVVDEME